MILYPQTMRMARRGGKQEIPFDLAQRLTGSNEADIRKDAQALLKLIQPKNPPAPLRGDPDPSGGSRRDALRTFTNQLMNND